MVERAGGHKLKERVNTRWMQGSGGLVVEMLYPTVVSPRLSRTTPQFTSTAVSATCMFAFDGALQKRREVGSIRRAMLPQELDSGLFNTSDAV